MDLRILTEPQRGVTYDALRRVAVTAEECGFSGFYRSDHYMDTDGGDGRPGPTDAWLTMAALARETTRIRIGVLMSAITFRLPGPLALGVAQVDEMSGGRVDFGIGAGWYAAEHLAYGIPFPEVRERFERLREQIQVITGLWTTPEGETFSYDGRYYRLRESPALPKPVQRPHPPILMGGVGRRTTPRLAAEYADEFNIPFHSPGDTGRAFARVRTACADIGRRVPVFSAAQVACCGRNEAEARNRAARIGLTVEDLRVNGLVGTASELVDKIGRLAELGTERVYLELLDPTDLAQLELIASEVMPQLPVAVPPDVRR